MRASVPVVVMRGGTSKGLYFRKEHLPDDEAERDRLLLHVMGSPDVRQIDGMGGGHPLTSKVAVVSRSPVEEADVDYLFLQVGVDRALVTDGQNCGNILAGVGPFAIEQGIVRPTGDVTEVRVRMLNSGGIAIVRVETPKANVTYAGKARIDGVPGTAAPVHIDFADVAGSSCGSLFPTGNTVDEIDGVRVTCIENGMPVVMLRASDLGASGDESPEELEADGELKGRVESIRRQAGPLMNLGDVEHKTVPKVSLISPARSGGAVSTRTFIPHRVHQSIGVLGAASVAAACRVPGTVADGVAAGNEPGPLEIEHPTGHISVDVCIAKRDGRLAVTRSVLLRTARKLMEGTVYPSERNNDADH